MYKWVDVALEPPIAMIAWRQVLFVLFQLPIDDPSYGDVRLGIRLTTAPQCLAVICYDGGACVLQRLSQPDAPVSRIDESSKQIVMQDGTEYSFVSTLFTGLQFIAEKHNIVCMREMMTIRDEGLARASPEARGLKELPTKMGRVEQPIPELALRLLDQLVPDAGAKEDRAKYDSGVILAVLSYAANLAMSFFRGKLAELFPDARVVDKRELEFMTEAMALLIAPVKNGPRVLAKLQEYVQEYGHDPSNWPFAKFFGDMLRCAVASRAFSEFSRDPAPPLVQRLGRVSGLRRVSSRVGSHPRGIRRSRGPRSAQK